MMLNSNVLALWLITLLGGAAPEQAAIKSFRQQELSKAALLVSLAQGRKRKRRERWSRWNDEQVRLLYFGGRIAMLRKRPREAASLFEQAAKKPTFYPKFIYTHWIDALIASKQWDKAVKTAEKAKTEYGGRLFRREMRRKIGEALRKGKKWSALAEHWRKLLWYPNPYGGRRRVMWKMTYAYLKANDIKNAARHLRKFELDYPLGWEAKRAKQHLTRWAKAGKTKYKPFTANETLHRYYRMSVIYPTKGIAILKDALQKIRASKDKDLEEYLMLLYAKALMRKRRYKQALPVWRALKKKTGSLKMARRAIKGMTTSLIELAQFKEAHKILHKFAEEFPETKLAERASRYSAWLAMRLQRYEDARKHFRDYQAIYPYSHFTKGMDWYIPWTLFRQGEYRKAIRAFKKWGRKRPSYKRMRKVRFWSARAYERMGKWERAKRLYVRISKGKPFSYYGILSQYRLYLLEARLKILARPPTCAHRKSKKHKRLSLRVSRMLKHHKGKRQKKPLWTPVLDKRLFGVSNLFGYNKAFMSKRALKLRKQQVTTAKALLTNVSFPKAPAFCRRSPGSRSCRYLRKATLFERLGFQKDAIQQLYGARWLLRHHQDELLQSVRWLLSVGGFHEALRLSFYLKRRITRKRLKLDFMQVLRLHYPQAYRSLLFQNSRRYGVPFAFAWSIMRTESHFRKRATSWVGARGLMQIMPSTGRKIARRIGMRPFHSGMLYTPKVNVRMGCWYLGELLKKFEGNVMLAAASYNAGPHRVAAWLTFQQDLDADEFVEEIPFRETRRYVKKVFRTYILYNFLYLQKLPPPPYTVAVRVGQNINF